VIIESPYAGNVRRNRRYLRACLRDSLRRGEFPFASHVLYASVLRDDDPTEREQGIRAGLAWGLKADAAVVYADLGISSGMARGIQAAHEAGRPVGRRLMGGTWAKPFRTKGGRR
jgi:hypothetical protein